MANRQTSTDGIELDLILPLEKFCERFSDLTTEPRMRWLIFNRAANGLETSGAIVRRCDRWHVVVPRYRDWLLSA